MGLIAGNIRKYFLIAGNIFNTLGNISPQKYFYSIRVSIYNNKDNFFSENMDEPFRKSKRMAGDPILDKDDLFPACKKFYPLHNL